MGKIQSPPIEREVERLVASLRSIPKGKNLDKRAVILSFADQLLTVDKAEYYSVNPQLFQALSLVDPATNTKLYQSILRLTLYTVDLENRKDKESSYGCE